MGDVKIPRDVLLIVSILYSKEDSFKMAIEELNNAFGIGRISEYKGNFDLTDYYNKELGTPIQRRFWVCDKLFKRESLPDIKLRTNIIERQFLQDGKRVFNLDPGFLSAENFILATTKNYTHRIYLRDGIYADLTLVYREKEYRALEWTYPDYAGKDIREFLKHEREGYLRGLGGD